MHYIDSPGARSGGTTVPFSGTSPPHRSRQKTELGALGPASGRRPANGTGVRGRGERPEAFRGDSCPSNARLVARGGGAGGCGAWWLRTASTLHPRRPQLLAPPARRWVWSTRSGVRGADGGWGAGGVVGALAHLQPRTWSKRGVRSRAGLGLGGATPTPRTPNPRPSPVLGELRRTPPPPDPLPHRKQGLVVHMDRMGDVCDLRAWKEKLHRLSPSLGQPWKF